MCDCKYRVHPGIDCGDLGCSCHPKVLSPIRVVKMPVEVEPSLERDLQSLLNRYSAESVSGTPDFILAEFVLDSLKAYNAAVVKRADWRGEMVDFDPRVKEN